MCNVNDGFKLCTCNNIEMDDAGWVLERNNPSLPEIHTCGSAIEMILDTDEVKVKHWILQELNKRNCFDFNLKPKARDLLSICINQERSIWVYYRYKNKSWQEDDGYPFADWKQKLEAFKHGIVKND